MEFIREHVTDSRVEKYIELGNQAALNCLGLGDLQITIDQLENAAELELTGEKLDMVKIYFSVLEKSASFWLPVPQGGSGVGYAVLAKLDETGNSTPDPQGISKKARYIMAADASGAAGAFLEFGIAAGLGGPAGVGALGFAVGFGAAWSSGTAALW